MMFPFQKIWFPDGERHFPEWMRQHGAVVEGRGTYQLKKWQACERWIRSWRVAIDVGAHVGLWTLQMVRRFQLVHAFEPISLMQDCWRRNLSDAGIPFQEGALDTAGADDAPSAVLYPVALGATSGEVELMIPSAGDGGIDSGGTHVIERGAGAGAARRFSAPLRTLDSFAFEEVDFLKIDCEGYELKVVEGAIDMLRRCRPCVIVEQKERCLSANYGMTGRPAVDMLVRLGAVVRAEIGGDYILSWS